MRRPATHSGDRGLTLLEVVLVFSVMGLLAAVLAPMGKGLLDIYKAGKVREDLRKIAAGLEAHWLGTHTGTYDATYGYFPTSLRSTGFLDVYLSSGTGNEDVITDKFGVNQDYLYSATGTPAVVTIYSRGVNRTDNSGGGDDVKITVDGTRIGRLITKQKLEHIARSATEWINANKYQTAGPPPTDAWSLAAVNGTTITTLHLASYYTNDGWGSAWVINSTHFRIYSIGPNRTDDTGGAGVTTALAGDDIGL